MPNIRVKLIFMDITAKSTEDWEREVGGQFRRARLRADIDQVTLAAKANVSVGALQNLESGRGCTLRTLIRVARALGRTDWLESFEPDPGLSPLAFARAIEGQREPQRASRSRRG